MLTYAQLYVLEMVSKDTA